MKTAKARALAIAFAPALAAFALFRPATAQGLGDAEKLVELIEKIASEAQDSGPNRLLAATSDDDLRALARIYPVLAGRRLSVSFAETPLPQVVDFLADVAGVNLVLSGEARKRAQEGDLRVTLKLKDISLKNCLELVLMNCDKDLAYGVKHGVLWIGLKEEWKGADTAILDFYPVDDLINTPPDFPAPKLGLKGLEPGTDKD